MTGKDNSYRWSIVAAVLLHLAIFIFLFIKFVPHKKPLSATSQAANIVQATVVDQMPASPPPTPVVQKKIEPQSSPTPPPAKPKEQAVPVKTAKPKKKETDDAQRKKQQQQLLQQQIAAEKQQLAGQMQTQEAQGEIDKYKSLIVQSISSYWIVPENLDKGLLCQLSVRIAPGGVVLSVDIVKSSGNDLLDRSAKAAVLKASPLPVPDDPKLFNEFRTIKLNVRPEGIM